MSIAGKLHDEDYLGDGVYVGQDGWHIWLRTERENGWHEIALEPGVLERLEKYVAELSRRTLEARAESTKDGPSSCAWSDQFEGR